ncbi:SIS domain-containing protein [Bacillus sp. FJAT-50079]|uniref:SIS domain-containing protein n=1 Tax=Bacillus sp. FJAT-50079 TaxID=2833577 RepID=UPI001BC94E45|nr:SIS domain-containing protein [Bacillus sp. FJAT-50079]MBS4206895.1 SIS domain-containing protein [Bacillus sp. FJAT-50079]
MANSQAEKSHTIREIEQQPALWVKAVKQFATEKAKMEAFLGNLEKKHENIRVIFTGAGTSAFIGETIYPSVRQSIRNRGWEAECISTTNLTAAPYLYLDAQIPTIMVSFARSGNSPESVAAVELAEQIVKDFYEITITCNHDGALAKRERTEEEQLVLLLPDEANDKGLAMTSSYSTMMLTALYLFSEKKEQFEQLVERIADAGEKMLKASKEIIPSLVKESISRLVYLGSGVFEGLSRESSLKCLELTGGSISTMYDTPLGFRHGPKSILNKEAMVVVFLSNDSYTRKYDLDILKELYEEKNRGPLVAISEYVDSDVSEYCDTTLTISANQSLDDMSLAFSYVIFAQLFAYEKSLHGGISPDNPSPDGVINRVVQGVQIYPYHEEKK